MTINKQIYKDLIETRKSNQCYKKRFIKIRRRNWTKGNKEIINRNTKKEKKVFTDS